jgi:hypothetical protein
MKLPKMGSALFPLLLFIGENTGVTTTQVQRFLIEKVLGKQWDPVRRAGIWNASFYNIGTKKGFFSKYCLKFENKWFLTEETAAELNKLPSIKSLGIKLIHKRKILPISEVIPKAHELSFGVANHEQLPKLSEPTLSKAAVNQVNALTQKILDLNSAKQRLKKEINMCVAQISYKNDELAAIQKIEEKILLEIKEILNI